MASLTSSPTPFWSSTCFFQDKRIITIRTYNLSSKKKKRKKTYNKLHKRGKKNKIGLYLKGIILENSLCDVDWKEFTHIISTVTKCHLSKVICPKGEKLCMLSYLSTLNRSKKISTKFVDINKYIF
jgi:hypothetical protein